MPTRWYAAALVVMACSSPGEPPRTFDPVGTWALESIDNTTLPAQYYASSVAYYAVAETLTVRADSSCVAWFRRGVIVGGQMSTSDTTVGCTWHARNDTVSITGFYPSFRPSYDIHQTSNDTLFVLFVLGSGSGLTEYWRFTRLAAP